MAFDVDNLALVGGVKGSTPQIWAYQTNDAIATVDGAGYFDNGATTNTGMRGLMVAGDLIYIVGTADTVKTFGLLVVNSVASGIIDVSSATLLGTIDSD